MSWKTGFKAFESVEGRDDAGTCRGFLFEEGQKYKIDGELQFCKNGFHACKDAVLCFEYYPDATLFAEVEFLGECDYEQPTHHKGVTSEIYIKRFFHISELIKDSDRNSGYRNSGYRNSGDWNSGDGNSGDWNSGDGNSGDWNSGHRNSGYRNSGDRNSGDRNSGYRNSGYRNSGDRNSGERNSGHRNSGYRNSGDWNSGYSNSGYRNSGDWNSGDWNSGDRNSGDCNSGDWNSCNNETGFFNSQSPKTINVFNKPCAIDDWINAKKPSFIYFDVDVSIGYKKSFQKSFENASDHQIKLLKALPNFDADVFFEISGIRV